MARVTVTALSEFSYQGRVIEAGEPIELRAIEAAIYARRGLVSLSRGAHLRTPEPPLPEPVADAPKPKRRYRRRDLRADE